MTKPRKAAPKPPPEREEPAPVLVSAPAPLVAVPVAPAKLNNGITVRLTMGVAGRSKTFSYYDADGKKVATLSTKGTMTAAEAMALVANSTEA